MRNVLAVAVLLAGSAALQAQAPVVRQTPDQAQTQTQTQDQTQGQMPRHWHRPSAAHETRMLTKKLGLSADQASQVGPILTDRQQRMEALRTNASLTPEQMHQQRRAIMEDTQQKLNALLTDPQKQQLAAMRAEHHHRGPQQGPAATPNA